MFQMLHEKQEERYQLSIDVTLGPKPGMLKHKSIISWKTRRVFCQWKIAVG